MQQHVDTVALENLVEMNANPKVRPIAAPRDHFWSNALLKAIEMVGEPAASNLTDEKLEMLQGVAELIEKRNRLEQGRSPVSDGVSLGANGATTSNADSSILPPSSAETSALISTLMQGGGALSTLGSAASVLTAAGLQLPRGTVVAAGGAGGVPGNNGLGSPGRMSALADMIRANGHVGAAAALDHEIRMIDHEIRMASGRDPQDLMHEDHFSTPVQAGRNGDAGEPGSPTRTRPRTNRRASIPNAETLALLAQLEQAGRGGASSIPTPDASLGIGHYPAQDGAAFSSPPQQLPYRRVMPSGPEMVEQNLQTTDIRSTLGSYMGSMRSNGQQGPVSPSFLAQPGSEAFHSVVDSSDGEQERYTVQHGQLCMAQSGPSTAVPPFGSTNAAPEITRRTASIPELDEDQPPRRQRRVIPAIATPHPQLRGMSTAPFLDGFASAENLDPAAVAAASRIFNSVPRTNPLLAAQQARVHQGLMYAAAQASQGQQELGGQGLLYPPGGRGVGLPGTNEVDAMELSESTYQAQPEQRNMGSVASSSATQRAANLSYTPLNLASDGSYAQWSDNNIHPSVLGISSGRSAGSRQGPPSTSSSQRNNQQRNPIEVRQAANSMSGHSHVRVDRAWSAELPQNNTLESDTLGVPPLLSGEFLSQYRGYSAPVQSGGGAGYYADSPDAGSSDGYSVAARGVAGSDDAWLMSQVAGMSTTQAEAEERMLRLSQRQVIFESRGHDLDVGQQQELGYPPGALGRQDMTGGARPSMGGAGGGEFARNYPSLAALAEQRDREIREAASRRFDAPPTPRRVLNQNVAPNATYAVGGQRASANGSRGSIAGARYLDLQRRSAAARDASSIFGDNYDYARTARDRQVASSARASYLAQQQTQAPRSRFGVGPRERASHLRRQETGRVFASSRFDPEDDIAFARSRNSTAAMYGALRRDGRGSRATSNEDFAPATRRTRMSAFGPMEAAIRARMDRDMLELEGGGGGGARNSTGRRDDGR
ncbi:unnamed protein product [Amoebophrya sp. A25]|nr:unnamed protein product [Amoebophrya sp. A25]|eukprot:GSA25T00022611001.1